VEELAFGTKYCCAKRNPYVWMDMKMLLVQKCNDDANVDYTRINLSIKVGWF
jgi:hypothetical protein